MDLSHEKPDRSTTDPAHAEPAPVVDYVALAAGRTVGRYEIVEVLGQGGFGITYRARDTQLGRDVAIKEYLPPTLAIRQDGASVLPRSTEVADDFSWGRERFVAEGRTLATLHEAPAIVQVFDFVEANGTSYMVMELVRGNTLEQRVKEKGPLAPHEIDKMLVPVLEGLQRVHTAGFLHRDIKPGNVLLGENGLPTLIDFGAARLAIASRSSTMTAIFTPGYAAPEQFAAGKQGPWTDIYGLAATLHHAITGKAPPNAFDRLLDDTYEPLATLHPAGFPSALLSAIDAGLETRLEHRPQSIAAWRVMMGLPDDDATIVMTQPATPAAPVAPPTPPTPPSAPADLAIAPRPRWQFVALLGGGAALVLLATAYYFMAPPLQPSAESVATAPAASASTSTDPQQAARTAEEALQLIAADRQRIQVVLTAMGFDTRGSDGNFGQRSREMIAAWQKAKGHAPTGYLTAAQVPALLRDAPATPASQASPPTARPTATTTTTGQFDGLYGGGMSASGIGNTTAIVTAEVSIAKDRLIGRVVHPGCGNSALTLTVLPSGDVVGSGKLYEAPDCALASFTATGRAAGDRVSLELRTPGGTTRGTLAKRGG
jgi:serine/threonine protein kinase